jgi:hypothetical protein
MKPVLNRKLLLQAVRFVEVVGPMGGENEVFCSRWDLGLKRLVQDALGAVDEIRLLFIILHTRQFLD